MYHLHRFFFIYIYIYIYLFIYFITFMLLWKRVCRRFDITYMQGSTNPLICLLMIGVNQGWYRKNHGTCLIKCFATPFFLFLHRCKIANLNNKQCAVHVLYTRCKQVPCGLYSFSFQCRYYFIFILNISSDQNNINSVSSNLLGFANNISFLHGSA